MQAVHSPPLIAPPLCIRYFLFTIYAPMKYCSRCQRSYPDETLNFCRHDGAVLVSELSADDESSPTVNLPSSPAHKRGRATEPIPIRHTSAVQSEDPTIAEDANSSAPTKLLSRTHTSARAARVGSGSKRRNE
jgi:hypothetical protein